MLDLNPKEYDIVFIMNLISSASSPPPFPPGSYHRWGVLILAISVDVRE